MNPTSYYADEGTSDFPELLIDRVDIYSMDDGHDGKSYLGKIDTGADLSIIPQEAVEELSLEIWDNVQVKGAFDEDKETSKDVYWVRVEIGEVANVVRKFWSIFNSRP